jgi:hypothetical protein
MMIMRLDNERLNEVMRHCDYGRGVITNEQWPSTI